MTIRGGAGPRDGRETGGRRPPMARRSNDPGASGPAPDRGPGRAGTITGYEMARSRRRSGIGGLVGFVVFVGIAAVVVLLALGTVLRPLTRSVVVGFADGNPGALGLPFVAELVREDLGEAMTAPASSDTTEVDFTVTAGETAAGIAGRLVDDGLLRDPRAFLLIAIDRGVTSQLDAGTFLLRRNLTPDQLVGTLLEAKDPSLLIQLRTGLRLEQMTAYLQARPDEIATLADGRRRLPGPRPQAAGGAPRRLPVARPAEGRHAGGLPRGRRLPRAPRHDGRGAGPEDARPVHRGRRARRGSRRRRTPAAPSTRS